MDSKSRETIAEVEHVARQNPELTIRPFFAALPDSEVWTIGRIRKLLLDAVISRVYDRQSNNREHILFTTDADGRGIHPCLVEYFLHTFDKHPHVDAIRGRVDWDWKSLTQNPLLLLGVRAMSLLDAHRRLAESDYSVGTPSLGIRVDRYMDAGGYHALDKVGEDMDLLARLKAIRSGSTVYNPILRGGPQSRVWTSLRRAEQALEIDMTPPANMWFVDGARFELEDAGVRQGPRVERGTFEDQLRSETFLPDAEKLLLKTLSTYALPHADPPVSLTDLVEVVNRYTGFEIRTGPEKNSLTVGNPDRLCSLLLYFKEHAEPYWRVQLGFEW